MKSQHSQSGTKPAYLILFMVSLYNDSDLRVIHVSGRHLLQHKNTKSPTIIEIILKFFESIFTRNWQKGGRPKKDKKMLNMKAMKEEEMDTLVHKSSPPKTNVKYCLTPPPKSCVKNRIPPLGFFPPGYIIFDHSLNTLWKEGCAGIFFNFPQNMSNF